MCCNVLAGQDMFYCGTASRKDGVSFSAVCLPCLHDVCKTCTIEMHDGDFRAPRLPGVSLYMFAYVFVATSSSRTLCYIDGIGSTLA